MRVKLQLVMCGDDDCEETVTDLVTLKKDGELPASKLDMPDVIR